MVYQALDVAIHKVVSKIKSIISFGNWTTTRVWYSGLVLTTINNAVVLTNLTNKHCQFTVICMDDPESFDTIDKWLQTLHRKRKIPSEFEIIWSNNRPTEILIPGRFQQHRKWVPE